MIDKIYSGRFWLTIITGLAFAYATWKRVLEPQAIASIITMVFMAYFQRTDRKQENGGVK